MVTQKVVSYYLQVVLIITLQLNSIHLVILCINGVLECQHLQVSRSSVQHLFHFVRCSFQVVQVGIQLCNVQVYFLGTTKFKHLIIATNENQHLLVRYHHAQIINELYTLMDYLTICTILSQTLLHLPRQFYYSQCMR